MASASLVSWSNWTIRRGIFLWFRGALSTLLLLVDGQKPVNLHDVCGIYGKRVPRAPNGGSAQQPPTCFTKTILTGLLACSHPIRHSEFYNSDWELQYLSGEALNPWIPKCQLSRSQTGQTRHLRDG